MPLCASREVLLLLFLTFESLSCLLPPSRAGHLKEGDIVDTVVEYLPPAPRAGIHRYVFLVYEQVRGTAAIAFCRSSCT